MNMKFMFNMMAALAAAMLVMTMFLMTKNSSMMLEWKIMETSSNSMNFNLMMDWKSAMFMFTVMIISSSIIMYSKFYMTNKDKTKFIKIILTFVSSMILLIVSPNMISMIMGWEGLGMSSFILIMFFMNKKSLMSSIYTIVMNRMGDIMLMISLMMMMDYNSWMMTSLIIYGSKTMMTVLCISLFSKSAQIPFSSWLTEAMAAPTPVSALVHSSTLVTAGVYMMIRMELSIKFSMINKMIMITALMTLVMASMNAILEWDIKKVVALSTLTQLSTMFIAISINMYKMAMFHMFMHATFKALLFVCSSSMISLTNSQDIRKISTTTQTSLITTISFNMSNLILSGMIFMSGFYSKELIIEMMVINKMAYIFMTMFCLSMMTTLFYSTKMIMFSCTKKSKIKMKMNKESVDQVMSKLVILMPSILSGNKMNWMMNLNNKIPYTTYNEKIAPVIIMITMIVMMKEMYLNKTLKKNKSSTMMINYMWFMKNFSVSVKMLVFNKMFEMNKISETGKLSWIQMTMTKKMKKWVMKNTKFSHTQFKKMMMMMMITMITLI